MIGPAGTAAGDQSTPRGAGRLILRNKLLLGSSAASQELQVQVGRSVGGFGAKPPRGRIGAVGPA